MSFVLTYSVSAGLQVKKQIPQNVWVDSNKMEQKDKSENLPSTMAASAWKIKTIVSQMELLMLPPLWPIPFSHFVFSNPVSFCSLGKCHISTTICCMFSMWKSGEQPGDRNHITMRGSWTGIIPELPHCLSWTCSRDTKSDLSYELRTITRESAPAITSSIDTWAQSTVTLCFVPGDLAKRMTAFMTMSKTCQWQCLTELNFSVHIYSSSASQQQKCPDCSACVKRKSI